MGKPTGRNNIQFRRNDLHNLVAAIAMEANRHIYAVDFTDKIATTLMTCGSNLTIFGTNLMG